MSKTHFGGVFDGTIGSSPRLKGTHFNADLSIFSLQTLGYVMGIDRIERRREKVRNFDQRKNGGIAATEESKRIPTALAFGGPSFVVRHHRFSIL